MRKYLMLSAAALLVPGVALADGEAASPMSPHFVGVSVGWTQMDLPEHENAGAHVPVVGGLSDALSAQTDVDGVTYAFGIGKDLSSGWRVGAYARFFDGAGSAVKSVLMPNGTPTRAGLINGTKTLDAPIAVALTGVQALDVDVTEYAISGSIGHALFSMLRGDLVVSYAETDTEYANVIDVLIGAGPTTEQGITGTTFTTNGVEVAARLSGGLPLSGDISLNLGASGGYAFRNIDMNARQRWIQGGAVFNDSSTGRAEDVDGFVGHVDAALSYSLAPSTTIALTANYTYDETVPVYVAPVYTAGAVGSAATFTTEGQGSMTYGLRVVGRF